MTVKDLTAVQRYVLLTLMINADPMPYKIFSNSLKADKRQELVRDGLLEAEKTTKGIMLELTQKGHDRAFDELGGEAPARSGTPGIALYTSLRFIRELVDRTGTRPRDLFQFRLAGPLPTSSPAALGEDTRSGDVGEDTRRADLDERIRKAYAVVVQQPGDYIMLAQLREALPDVSRSDLDAALIQLNRSPDVNVVPESNQKVLTEAERAAAVSIGNQLKHLIAIKA
jgi:hypothetical protein